MTPRTIDTKNGTLHYEVVAINDGLVSTSYAGKITHDLHKHARLNGKKITRYSKNYKTQRGADNWLKKQYNIQRGRAIQ